MRSTPLCCAWAMATRLLTVIRWYSTIMVVHQRSSQPEGTSMTTAVQPFSGTYLTDPIHSSFGFGVKYAGAGTFRGTLDDVSATLAAGDDGLVLEGSARVESISIQNPPQFRAHVLGADFFDSENHPEVSFRSTRVELAEDGTARVDGQLTIAA